MRNLLSVCLRTKRIHGVALAILSPKPSDPHKLGIRGWDWIGTGLGLDWDSLTATQKMGIQAEHPCKKGYKTEGRLALDPISLSLLRRPITGIVIELS